MLFSVIVPIYKVEKFLNQCVDSVLNQSYIDFELILVDDGSPDKCGQMCDDFAKQDNRIKVIHKPNGGLVSARQAGAKTANGDYIVCLDGDDFLANDCLQIMADIIKSNNVDIVIGSSWWKYENKCVLHKAFKEIGLFNKDKIEKLIFPCLIEDKCGYYFSPNIWAKAIKRELYIEQQLAVNAKIKIGEDQAVVKPCIYRANSLYITEEPLYFYRQNDMSMTKNKSVFDLYGAELIATHFSKQIDLNKFDFNAQVNRRFVHDLFNASVSQFNENGVNVKEIKQRIKQYLNSPEVKEKINNCQFSIKNIKGNLALFALKTKNILLIKLYHDLKNK